MLTHGILAALLLVALLRKEAPGVDQERVRLSDPASRYYPAVDQLSDRPRSAPPVTLLQLATHTAGLAAEPERLEPFLRGAAGAGPAGVVSLAMLVESRDP
jgi:CubicO group peptidase (beta-lactamase class C family)